MNKIALVGIYTHADALIEAIHKLKEKKPDKMVVYTPFPFHPIWEAMELKSNPIRYFTLAGALLGLFGGFALAIWSSLKWNLITGGKPIVSFPPFVIIGFELTILLGTLATLFGLIVIVNWQSYKVTQTYDPRFSKDKFGLAIQIPEDEKSCYEEILHSTGAEEIHVR